MSPTKPEIVKEIIKDYINNIKVKEISEKYKVDQYTINTLVRKNNIPKRNKQCLLKIPLELEINVINDYNNKNLSTKYICDKYNISSTTILNILKRHNIQKRRKNPIFKFSKEQEKFLIENYPLLGYKNCAKQLNIPFYSVKAKIKKLRIIKLKPIVKEGFKMCSQCKKEKETINFQKNSRNKNKLNCACKECLNKKSNEYIKNKKKTNLQFKIITILRTRISAVIKLKGARKTKRTKELLGCDIDFFIKHLESLFHKNMNWDNYGKKGWHIDHIIPCHLFDLTNKEQQLKCFHYTNLRPLWATTEIAQKHGDFESIGNLNRTYENLEGCLYCPAK